MAKVYVVQRTMTRDGEGQLRERLDYSKALPFGELVFLLSPGAKPWDRLAIAEMREALLAYTEDDYIVAAGSAVMVGFAIALASQATGGPVQVLQWSGTQQRYIKIKMDLGKGELNAA